MANTHDKGDIVDTVNRGQRGPHCGIYSRNVRLLVSKPPERPSTSHQHGQDGDPRSDCLNKHSMEATGLRPRTPPGGWDAVAIRSNGSVVTVTRAEAWEDTTGYRSAVYLRRILATGTITFVLAGCGSQATPSTSHVTPPTATAQLRAAGVTASPSTNLRDRQNVTVTVRGLPPGWKFYVSECATPYAASAMGCGAQLAAQPFGVTNQSGDGSIVFTVQTNAATGPLNSSSTPCSGECVIVATVGVHGSPLLAPISFLPSVP